MIPDFVFNSVTYVKIIYYKLFGTNLQKLLIKISDEYYSLLADGAIHEDVINRIIKIEYGDDKKRIDDCTYFVYNRKQTIDTIFDSKYGKRGRFLSHLFKLVQKIHLDTNLNDNRKSYVSELNSSMISLNKHFNTIVLYMFSKYND